MIRFRLPCRLSTAPSRRAPTSALAHLLCMGLLMAGAGRAADADHGHGAEPAKAVKSTKAARADETAEPKLASAPATPPADALDQLRQRLAERLTAGKASATGGAQELRVAARAAAAPASVAAPAAPRPARPASHGSVRSAVKASPDPHGSAAAHWDYKGAGGPTAWGGLKPEFALCNSGQRQSPIDIRGGLAVDLDPVRFNYQASKFAVLDNGHTVQVNLAPGNTIEVGGRRFELQQFHFHRPSEERIDGRQFEMSLHLVHKDEQGRLAVVALLFDPGPAHPVLQQVWNNLPLERNEEAPARVALELADLLPTDRRYYTYMGSLTTPPCSEGVQWIVMRQPVTLTPQQLDIFARIYPMNARPLQAASGRRIMQSN